MMTVRECARLHRDHKVLQDASMHLQEMSTPALASEERTDTLQVYFHELLAADPKLTLKSCCSDCQNCSLQSCRGRKYCESLLFELS